MGVVDQLRAEAQRLPAPPAGHFRVTAIEASAKRSSRDFASRAEAVRCADDAAAETDDNPPIACVFDHRFELVHQGGK